MRVLLAGPELYSPRTVNGLQVFNILLCRTLREMGHDVHYAVLAGIRRQGSGGARFPGQHGLLILSGARLDYARILRAARRPALIWAHGQHVSPLSDWDGAELRMPGVRYVCTNGAHMEEAVARGFAAQAVMVDMPVGRRQVSGGRRQGGAGYCVAAGTLEPRKNYARVAEIAAALGVTTRVYGAPVSPEARDIVDASPWLKRMGAAPHEAVLEDLAGAEFLLHAARTEGRPTAVLEAMGLGVPVIVPDLPLYREFVDPVRNVLLDPARPVAEQLAGFDLETLRSPENREALEAETQAKYGLEAFKRQLEELLSPREACRKRGAPHA